jgi:hypothetical protein
MFDQLKRIKGEYAKTYEELEGMHRDLLVGRLHQNTVEPTLLIQKQFKATIIQ